MPKKTESAFDKVKKLFEEGARGKRRKVKVPDTEKNGYFEVSDHSCEMIRISYLEKPSDFYLYLYEKQLEKNKTDIKNMLKEMFKEPEKIFQIEETATSMKVKYEWHNDPYIYSFDVRPLKHESQSHALYLEEELSDTLNLLFSDDHVWEAHEDHERCNELIKEIIDLINWEIKARINPTESQILLAVKYGDFGRFLYRYYPEKEHKIYSDDGHIYDNTPLKK